MATKKTKFAVGLFLMSGIGITLVAVVWLGLSHFFEKGRLFASYFNESVQGLDVDSPVKYRGVPVGRVKQIGVAPDNQLIEVVMTIEAEAEMSPDLAAQLKVVGITGSMFIELDRKEEGEPDRSPTLSFTPEYPVIASKPSGIKALMMGIDDAIQYFKAMDVRGIAEQLKITFDHIDRSITGLDTPAMSAKVSKSLDRVNSILTDKRIENILTSLETAGASLTTVMEKAEKGMERLDRTATRMEGLMADKEQTIRTSIDEFRLALENTNRLLAEGTQLVSSTDRSIAALQGRLLTSSENLAQATENLNALLENLSYQPSQMLFGRPPAPRAREITDVRE